jgi:hypothetical protein
VTINTAAGADKPLLAVSGGTTPAMGAPDTAADLGRPEAAKGLLPSRGVSRSPGAGRPSASRRKADRETSFPGQRDGGRKPKPDSFGREASRAPTSAELKREAFRGRRFPYAYWRSSLTRAFLPTFSRR